MLRLVGVGFFVMAMRVSVIENARHAFHTVCFSNRNSADTIITSERTEEGVGASGNAHQDLATARCDEL